MFDEAIIKKLKELPTDTMREVVVEALKRSGNSDVVLKLGFKVT